MPVTRAASRVQANLSGYGEIYSIPVQDALTGPQGTVGVLEVPVFVMDQVNWGLKLASRLAPPQAYKVAEAKNLRQGNTTVCGYAKIHKYIQLRPDSLGTLACIVLQCLVRYISSRPRSLALYSRHQGSL